MARGLSKSAIEAEWLGLSKDWYSIYQWERAARLGYTEWIAEWIGSSFKEIRLVEDGLRARSFRAADHRGQIDPKSNIGQLNEKRLVRAMFNATNLAPLGRMIDYEVPLKEKNSSDHGDIDLLCTLSGICLCVEAKRPRVGDSLLKAVLQAFVYSSLVCTRKEAFLTSFNLDRESRLTPAVLTFADAPSGRQLTTLDRHPNLLSLIHLLNVRLVDEGLAPMRFFVVHNPHDELKNCLTTEETNGDKKPVFRKDFALSIAEQPLPA